MSRRPDPRREVAPAPALTTEPQRQHSLPSTTASALVDGPGAWVGELHERVGNLALGQALMSPEADAGYSEQLTAALADAPMLSRALRSNRHNQAALRRGALPQDFQLPSGQGRPLPEPVQERVSAALGRDVSKMRVHDDPAAAASLEQADALAAYRAHALFLTAQDEPLAAAAAARLVQLGEVWALPSRAPWTSDMIRDLGRLLALQSTPAPPPGGTEAERARVLAALEPPTDAVSLAPTWPAAPAP